MINKSLNMSGMMRCKVLMDGSIYRAYIPGVTNVEIFDENGEINGTAYETNKSSLPIIQWCAYNTQSCDLENGDGIYWCAFENGNIEKPIVISHTFIGGGTGNGSNSNNSSGSNFDGGGEYDMTGTKKSSTYSNSSGLAKVIEIFKQDCNGKPYGRDPGCYDCSSSTAHCFVKAGLIDSKYDGFTTETFFANFKAMGFKDITDEIGELTYDKLQVGDILWRAKHMAIYCGDGKMTFSNTANKNGIGGFSSDFSKVFRYVK